jgi:hypothetical protein
MLNRAFVLAQELADGGWKTGALQGESFAFT